MIFRLVKRERATIEAGKFTETFVIQELKLGSWDDLVETQDMVDAVILLTNIRNLGGIIKDTPIEV